VFCFFFLGFGSFLLKVSRILNDLGMSRLGMMHKLRFFLFCFCDVENDKCMHQYGSALHG
jgi:hypothetical protein